MRGFAFLVLVLLAGCRAGEPEPVYRFTRFAMDTVVEYTLVAPTYAQAEAAMVAAHAEVERVARLLSEQDAQSQVARFNRAGGGRVALDAETHAFVVRAYRYYVTSGGAFDLTIKPVLDLYDFKAGHPAAPTSDALRDRLQQVDMSRLRLQPAPYLEKPAGAPLAVAVGGVAKGYAVDRAVAVLRAHGVENALVNAGGDLYCLGRRHGRPWTVGVQDPTDPDGILEVLHLTDRAVATSGDYQRFFVVDGVRYHHLLDPTDGRPARRVRSATVVAATAEAADAFATALFVHGRDGLALLDRLPGTAGLVVDAGGRRFASRAFPGP